MAIHSLAEFAPTDVEAGVGLALRDRDGHFIFGVLGTRHQNTPGELWIAGIGGHREANESWVACAHREAHEELGTVIEIDIIPAQETWYLSGNAAARRVDLRDKPRPFALYEMIHPPGAPREGELYRIVIYNAILRGQPRHLPEDELLGLIAVQERQLIRMATERITLRHLVKDGAQILVGKAKLAADARIVSIGTAAALQQIALRLGDEL